MQTTPGTSLTDAPTPARGRLRPEIILWLTVALTAFVLDQATKWWAENALADGQPRQVIGDLLQFRLVYNPGAAFSTGTSYTVVLTFIALAVIVVVIKMAGKLRSRGWAVALGLILGGALGNVTDRIFRDPAPFRGEVVDFIELPHWPIFNLADCAITVAAVLFVLLSLRGIGLDGQRVDADDATDSATDDDQGDPPAVPPQGAQDA
jgi:signal peptidase II